MEVYIGDRIHEQCLPPIPWLHVLTTRRRLASLAAGFGVIFSLWAFMHYRHTDPLDRLLEQADDLSWNNRWLAASALYEKAEKGFASRNPSKALYAHVSQFVLRAEREPIQPLLAELRADVRRPEASEPETRLRILEIEGMLETNYDASQARTTWTEVASIAKRRGHYLLSARASGELGIAAFFLGDVATAKRSVQRAWIVAKLLRDDAAHVRYASVYGAGLVELHRYGDALRVLDEAINVATSSKTVAYPSIAVNYKIGALSGLHRYPEAIALADQAIQRLPAVNLDAHLYEILSSKGVVYADQGNWDAAILSYEKALAFARSLSYWRGIVQTAGLEAQALLNEGKLNDALNTVNAAIEANEQIPDELYYSPRNLALKAEILDRLGRSSESESFHQRSIILLDSLLATAPTPNIERDLLTDMRWIYSRYFESQCRSGNLEGAFLTIERARGRIEAQALANRPSPIPHPRTTIEAQIANLNLDVLERGSTVSGAKLQRMLVDNDLLLGDDTFSGRAFRRPMSLKGVRAHLSANELVLEYVLDAPTSSVLAISREGVNRYELPSEGEIEELAGSYRKSLHAKKSDTMVARKLFAYLLGTVPEYKAKTDIIVIPDGELHLLPFTALVEGDAYAIQTHTFSVTPSASVLAMLRDRASTIVQDSLDYVGVAAPSESQQPRKRALTSFWTMKSDRALAPLAAAETEVEHAARMFPDGSTVLLGDKATKNQFRKLPLANYRILHLALHGYVDLEYPDRSALVFAPEPNGIAGDHFLHLAEMRKLRLRAALVTLSACDTGVGPVSEADVANMGNAFIEAGAMSVVGALWDLEDRTTAAMMEKFYANLSRGDDKAAALRDAQLNILRAGLPPYYWASVEIMGDPSGRIR